MKSSAEAGHSLKLDNVNTSIKKKSIFFKLKNHIIICIFPHHVSSHGNRKETQCN